MGVMGLNTQLHYSTTPVFHSKTKRLGVTKQDQPFKLKLFAAISAMLWPMAKEAVAPGEGALST